MGILKTIRDNYGGYVNDNRDNIYQQLARQSTPCRAREFKKTIRDNKGDNKDNCYTGYVNNNQDNYNQQLPRQSYGKADRLSEAK